MLNDLESIPTSELIKKAERRPLEKAIVKSGCFLVVASTVGSWIAVFCFATSEVFLGLLLCFLALIVVPYVVFSALKFLAELRGHHLLHELDRRFGRWNILAYVRYYQERLEPGEIRCLFRGRALPHGRAYWACIKMNETETMSLEATVSHGPYRGIGPDPWSETEPSDREVAPNKRAEIRELIAKTKGTGKSRFSTGVKDGFPVWIAIVFGDGSESTIVSSNLSGLSDKQREDDRIRLLSVVAKLVCGDRRFVSDET